MKLRVVYAVGLVLFLVLAILMIAACGGGEPAAVPESSQPAAGSTTDQSAGQAPFPAEMPSAVHGQEIYGTNCAACHGAAGDGSALAGAANFTDLAFMRNQSPANFFTAISNGVAGTAMPPWKETLSDKEIWDVLYYNWAFATSPDEVATGQTLFTQNCVACHGAAGDGSALAGAANFTDQEFMSREKLAVFFEKIKDGVAGTAMPAWGETLSEDEIWALVNYVWTFAYEYPGS